jgi:hypothetical protein
MAYEQRLKLIKQIEELRGSKVVSYLTSLRPNLGAVMADDGVRVFFDHLLLLPSRPTKQLDIFLCRMEGAALYRGDSSLYFGNLLTA